MRAELLGKLAAAQFNIEAVIAELERAGTAPDAIRSQLQSLTDMQRAVGSANVADLAMLRIAIASTVETAQGVAQQARSAAAAESGTRDIAETTARTRATITGIANDVFEHRVLDPYLRFAVAEDEEAYRRREHANREAIDRELARGTPEGDLRAAQIMSRQLDDAEAHGAAASPDFASMRQNADQALRTASDVMRTSQDTAEMDNIQSAYQPTQAASASELDAVLAVLQAAGATPLMPVDEPPSHGVQQIARVGSVDRTEGRA